MNVSDGGIPQGWRRGPQQGLEPGGTDTLGIMIERGKNMAEQGKVCIFAGKFAGDVVRKTSGITEKLSGLCKGTEKVLSRAYEKIGVSTTTACRKLGNLCKVVKNSGGLAHWEEKEKEALLKLGTEVWKSHEEKTLKPLFENSSIKPIVKEINNCEQEIQEGREEIEEQKKRMDELAVFNHARSNLGSKNPRVRKVALRVLGKLGKKEAIPYISRLTNDPDSEVRQKAIEVLHELIDLSIKKDPISKIKAKEMMKMMDDAKDSMRKEKYDRQDSTENKKGEIQEEGSKRKTRNKRPDDNEE
ncbi:MAG: HEAT repeat domain-containing protein [Elusimicrobia bacterium]|nr:HEAT repeat domain-containing protein [Candidatus Liberimonas magnetica]